MCVHLYLCFQSSFMYQLLRASFRLWCWSVQCSVRSRRSCSVNELMHHKLCLPNTSMQPIVHACRYTRVQNSQPQNCGLLLLYWRVNWRVNILATATSTPTVTGVHRDPAQRHGEPEGGPDCDPGWVQGPHGPIFLFYSWHVLQNWQPH